MPQLIHCIHMTGRHCYLVKQYIYLINVFISIRKMYKYKIIHNVTQTLYLIYSEEITCD